MIRPGRVVILRHVALAADPLLLLELAVLEAQLAQRVVGHHLLAQQCHLDGSVGERSLLGPVLVAFSPGSDGRARAPYLKGQ